MRLVVPDADLLVQYRCDNYGDLNDFNEINDECEKAKTQAAKLHALLYGSDHKAIYDQETLSEQLREAGFVSHPQKFRTSVYSQMLIESLDSFPCLSLYMEGGYSV